MAELYTSRMVLRTRQAGRPVLSSLLTPASLHLSPALEAITQALWDRRDLRPTADRLRAPGVPEDPMYRDLLLTSLVERGLVVDGGVDEVAAWVRKLEAELEPLPRVDQIELTNACPFTCGFCPRGIGKMARPIGHLDLGLLADVVAEVKHLPQKKPFGLHHFGDPLLHPDPAGAIRIVADAGLQPEISFNPILLRERTADAMLEAGVGVVIVSMDGLDDHTLTTVRGRHAGPFDQAAKNLEYLIGAAATMAKPPTIMVSMVANVHNRHQWRELFRRYRRPEYPWLEPVVRLLEDFGDPDIIPLGVKRLRQLCGIPYTFVSVLWDGTVVPCCHDFDGKIPLGNLRESSLAELWHGPLMTRFRERWKARSFTRDEPCSSCHWLPGHYVAAEGMAEVDAWTPDLWSGKKGTCPCPSCAGGEPSLVHERLRSLFAYALPSERHFLAAQVDQPPLFGRLDDGLLARVLELDAQEIGRHRAEEWTEHEATERRLAAISADRGTFERLRDAYARRLAWKEELRQRPTGIVDLNLQVRGRLVSLRCPDSLESYLLVFEIFLAEPYEMPRPDGGVVYDLGAHVGVSALYFHAAFPGIELVCVEPIAENVAFLEENLRRNKVRARVHPVALGERAGEVELAVCPEATSLSSRYPISGLADTSSSSGAPPGHLTLERRTVEVAPFEAVVRGEGYGLKLDVEGAEHALADAPGVLERAAWVAGELHLGPGIVELGRSRRFQETLGRSHALDLRGPGVFGGSITYTFRGRRRPI